MPSWIVSRWGLAFVALALVGCSSPDEDPGEIIPDKAECIADDSSSAEQASGLILAEQVGGYICPIEDQDWYAVEIPQGDELIKISLSMSSPLSPIAPTYSLWEADGDAAGELVATPAGTEVGAVLADTHCVGSGTYYLSVRDDGNDSRDVRHQFQLLVESAENPDKLEPNDSEADAVALSSGAQEGSVACRGDEDWFSFDGSVGQVARFSLEAPNGAVQLGLQVFDPEGKKIFESFNQSGTAETDIEELNTLALDGQYHVLVSDDDGENADETVIYSLQVSLLNDTDENEPNNHPDQATPLDDSPLTCGSSWSGVLSAVGSIGSQGDVDWYVVDVSGCSSGLIEAELVFETDGLSDDDIWALSQEIQATLGMVRPHAESPCANDSECTALNKACEDNLECAGLFNTCLSEGLCSGAAVCLPNDLCGALQVQRSYGCDASDSRCRGSNPPPNQAILRAPLLSDGVVYLRVSDFQSNGGNPDVSYRLEVRVKQEEDSGEADNLFMDQIGPDIVGSTQPARTIPVHDCTAGDCCGSGTWEEGILSYDGDIDWYRYPHPCPGSDCTMRVSYAVDGGSVDHVISVHAGEEIWYSLFDIEEEESHASRNGSLGGSSEGDSCFYAYQGHDISYYYISVRDLLEYFPNGQVVPASRDWSDGQAFHLCVEKVADTCLEPPCKVYTNGCGLP